MFNNPLASDLRVDIKAVNFLQTSGCEGKHRHLLNAGPPVVVLVKRPLVLQGRYQSERLPVERESQDGVNGLL